MKRDMELCRKILFEIEDKYVDAVIYNLAIDGYSMAEVAYHCKLLHEAGLISAYSSQNADNHIYIFAVGALTWEGHDFLDKIRTDTVWNKTKDIISKKGLPMVLDVVKQVSTSLMTSMLTEAMSGIM